MQEKLNVEIYGGVYKKNAAICPVLAAFHIKNAAKTWPMAAFSVENAAIVIRPSAGETKCGDLWLRFCKKTQL